MTKKEENLEIDNLAIVDIETSGLDARKDYITGMGIYIPKLDKYIWTKADESALTHVGVDGWICHNAAFDLLFLHYNNIPAPEVVHDTKIMAMLIDERTKHNLENCIQIYVDKEYSWKSLTDKFVDRWKRSKKFRKRWCVRYPVSSPTMSAWEALPKSWLQTRNEYDCKLTHKLFLSLYKKLKSLGLLKLYYTELANMRACIQMRIIGLRIDKEYFLKLEHEYGVAIDLVVSHIKAYLNDSNFNPGSPKQVSKKLMDMGLSLSKTKKGDNFSTDERTLKKHKDQFPLCNYILEYRRLLKLRKTYAKNFLNRCVEEGNYYTIHPSFNSIGAVSGRYTSDMQQIPKDL